MCFDYAKDASSVKNVNSDVKQDILQRDNEMMWVVRERERDGLERKTRCLTCERMAGLR